MRFGHWGMGSSWKKVKEVKTCIAMRRMSPCLRSSPTQRVVFPTHSVNRLPLFGSRSSWRWWPTWRMVRSRNVSLGHLIIQASKKRHPSATTTSSLPVRKIAPIKVQISWIISCPPTKAPRVRCCSERPTRTVYFLKFWSDRTRRLIIAARMRISDKNKPSVASCFSYLYVVSPFGFRSLPVTLYMEFACTVVPTWPLMKWARLNG